MSAELPLISIVLPTYNGARTIARAIESVRAQDFSAWELLVVDDGSTDGMAEVVGAYAASDPRIRYLKNEANLGIQKSLNRGLREAQGAYIARIDDDDAWIDPKKLSAQYSRMLADPECVLVGTGVVVVNENGDEIFRYLLPKTDAEIRGRMLRKNNFIHSSVLFRKDAALGVGGYGESADVRHVEDYDLWLRLGTRGTLANLPLYAVAFTERAGSVSGMHKQEQFRKNLALARRHRNDYPGYGLAAARGAVLVTFYGMFGLLPKGLRQTLIAWDKKKAAGQDKKI